MGYYLRRLSLPGFSGMGKFSTTLVDPKSVQKKQVKDVFRDAKEFPLLALAYCRIVYADYTVQVKFIMSKARVAPIKRKSIPNLELQAAVYGAQLSQSAHDESDYKISQVKFSSDRTTVLY